MSTMPAACARVFAVMVWASTRGTLDGTAPPIVNEAPVWKPLPLKVMVVPPLYEPLFGVMVERITGGVTGRTLTSTDLVSVQPPLSIFRVMVQVPAAPAVKEM